MKTKQTKAERITELERKLQEAIAGHASALHFACAGLDKSSTDHLAASGVVLTLTVLGGRKICEPVLIRDGLSKETIAALKGDLVRSFEVATLFKPKL